MFSSTDDFPADWLPKIYILSDIYMESCVLDLIKILTYYNDLRQIKCLLANSCKDILQPINHWDELVHFPLLPIFLDYLGSVVYINSCSQLCQWSIKNSIQFIEQKNNLIYSSCFLVRSSVHKLSFVEILFDHVIIIIIPSQILIYQSCRCF